MNIQLINNYLEKYKSEFKRIHKQEIYKWKAFKCFKDNWNLYAEDFALMLENSLALTKNLLHSGDYYPARMIIKNAQKQPEAVRLMFKNLLDEDKDVLERIVNFQKKSGEINQQNFERKKDYQDHRAIIVYLSLAYPEIYYLYKFTMFKDFVNEIEYNYRPVKGRIENIGHYQSLCELVKYELLKDQELLKLHKDRIEDDCYFDKNYNILTQDFIYAVVAHLDNEVDNIVSEQEIGKIEHLESAYNSLESSKNNFNPSFSNHIQREINNKRIGDLGELWIVDYEKNKLRNLGLNDYAERVVHLSKERGDGAGYDIKSFNELKEEIFIEVKTTNGVFSNPFYITRTELERSKKENERYYLYRVYNFDEINKKGDLAIINGKLTNYCQYPSNYKVKLAK